eukprot:g7822.t3
MSTLTYYAFFLLCVASRAHAFAFCPTLVWEPKFMYMGLRCHGKVGAAHATQSEAVEQGTTRSGMVRIMGASIAGTLSLNALPCAAARTKEELVQLLSDARKQLDPVDQMIDDARWDSIRTIIKTSPLSDVKNVIAELARQSDDDESALLLGLRQDVLDHVQYLDSFSYNNVFVGEERQILGTKIDFDTPRMELRQAREAFDIIMEVLP